MAVMLSEMINWKIRRLFSFKRSRLDYNSDGNSSFITHQKINKESCSSLDRPFL